MDELYYLNDQFDRMLVRVIDGNVANISIIYRVSDGCSHGRSVRDKIMTQVGQTFEGFKEFLIPIYAKAQWQLI